MRVETGRWAFVPLQLVGPTNGGFRGSMGLGLDLLLATTLEDTLNGGPFRHVSLVNGGVVQGEGVLRLLGLFGHLLMLLLFGLATLFVEEGKVIWILALLSSFTFFDILVNG